MTIDETIRKARREAELRGDICYDDDLYEPYIPPERTVDVKKYVKLVFEIVIKFVFFVVLLYIVWIGLSTLNTAVKTGKLQSYHNSVIDEFKVRYDNTVVERNDLDNMADNLTEEGPLVSETEDNMSIRINEGVEDLMNSTLDRAMSKFDELIGKADEAMNDLNNY